MSNRLGSGGYQSRGGEMSPALLRENATLAAATIRGVIATKEKKHAELRARGVPVPRVEVEYVATLRKKLREVETQARSTGPVADASSALRKFEQVAAEVRSDRPSNKPRYRSGPSTSWPAPSTLPTLAVDFNGVLHDSTRGDKGILSPDSPAVPGAIPWLTSIAQHFAIAVQSARFALPDEDGEEAREKARDWLVAQGVPSHWVTVEPEERGRIHVTGLKVPSHLSIDDRAMTFNGTFPTADEMLDFVPWNR
jgi:hypothetical protein